MTQTSKTCLPEKEVSGQTVCNVQSVSGSGEFADVPLHLDPQLCRVLKFLHLARVELESAYRRLQVTGKPNAVYDDAYKEFMESIDTAGANTSVLIGEKAVEDVKEAVMQQREVL